MVRRNDQGQTAVIFGDGEQGARLPTSREILTAAYRSGGGETGNLPAGGLTLLQSHLPYVKEVTNPAPAQGGLPAESAGHGREQAPRRVRALGRIVTLKDYSDFTATFPGVSQSAVRALPEQAPRWIEIAILPKHDPQADPAQTAPLLTELEKAIHRSRSSAILPVKLHLYRPIFFSLAMQLHLSAEMRGDENRQNYLKQAVRRKILERYSLEKQTLGGAVIETEIFQRVQSVHGILAVTLTSLQKTDPAAEGMEVPLPVSQLTANWDELLLLTANDLTVEVLE
jgi:predicted phage baseplate assembly protein